MSNPGGFSSGPFSHQDHSGRYGGYSQEHPSPSQKRTSSSPRHIHQTSSPIGQPVHAQASYDAYYQRSSGQLSVQQQSMHPSTSPAKSPLVLQPGMRVLVKTSSGFVSTQLSQQSVATLLGNQIPQPPPHHERPSVIRSFPPQHTGAVAFAPAMAGVEPAPMQFTSQAQSFDLLSNNDQFQFDGSLFGLGAPNTHTGPPYMGPAHFQGQPAPFPSQPPPAMEHMVMSNPKPHMAPQPQSFSAPVHFTLSIPSDSPSEARPPDPTTPAKSTGGDSAADDKGLSSSPGSGGKSQYLCKYCGKRCVCASALTVHLRTHSGERPYSCTQCNRQFSRKSHLKVHQRVHSGEKPFACEICSKSFSQMSNLRAHARTHTGERPFMCEHCDKTFAVSSSLKSHQRMHTGAHVSKAHLCDKCHKCFAWAGTLQKHKKTHEVDGGGDAAYFDEEEEDAACEAQALAQAWADAQGAGGPGGAGGAGGGGHGARMDDATDGSPMSASMAPSGAALAPWQRPVLRPNPRAPQLDGTPPASAMHAVQHENDRPAAPVNTPVDEVDTPVRLSAFHGAGRDAGRTRRESEGLPYDSPFPEFDMMS